ncbi:hypothetical protein CCH79_00020866, partial [Gambusia affinis]
MVQCEDTEEGDPPSKTTLCGEGEGQTKGHRIHQRLNPEPEPSCVSFKSEWSKDLPVKFKASHPSSPESCNPEIGTKPESSCIYTESNIMEERIIRDSILKLNPVVYHSGSAELRGFQWSICPAAPNTSGLHIYGLYMFNNYFSIGSVPSSPCGQIDSQSVQYESDLLEENIVTFVKNELKKIKKTLSPDDPECPESQKDDEQVLEGEDEEQRCNTRDSVMKITLKFLRRMKQEELADYLQSKHLAAVCQRQLKSGLKRKFQCVFEGIDKAG